MRIVWYCEGITKRLCLRRGRTRTIEGYALENVRRRLFSPKPKRRPCFRCKEKICTALFT